MANKGQNPHQVAESFEQRISSEMDRYEDFVPESFSLPPSSNRMLSSPLFSGNTPVPKTAVKEKPASVDMSQEEISLLEDIKEFTSGIEDQQKVLEEMLSALESVEDRIKPLGELAKSLSKSKSEGVTKKDLADLIRTVLSKALGPVDKIKKSDISAATKEAMKIRTPSVSPKDMGFDVGTYSSREGETGRLRTSTRKTTFPDFRKVLESTSSMKTHPLIPQSKESKQGAGIVPKIGEIIATVVQEVQKASGSLQKPSEEKIVPTAAPSTPAPTGAIPGPSAAPSVTAPVESTYREVPKVSFESTVPSVTKTEVEARKAQEGVISEDVGLEIPIHEQERIPSAIGTPDVSPAPLSEKGAMGTAEGIQPVAGTFPGMMTPKVEEEEAKHRVVVPKKFEVEMSRPGEGGGMGTGGSGGRGSGGGGLLDSLKNLLGKRVAKKVGKEAGEAVAKKTGKAVAKKTGKEVGEAVAKKTGKEVGEAVAKKTGKEVGEAVAEKTGKEVGEAVTEKTGKEVGEAVAEKTGKEVGEKVLKEGGEAAAKKGIGSAIKKAVASKIPSAIKKPIAKGVEKLGAKGLAKFGGKALGKSVLKKIPGVSVLAGLGFGGYRALHGDWAGAGLEVASGALGSIPGLGTLGSAAIDVGLAGRDIYKEVAPIAKEVGMTPTELLKQTAGGALGKASEFLSPKESEATPKTESSKSLEKSFEKPSTIGSTGVDLSPVEKAAGSDKSVMSGLSSMLKPSTMAAAAPAAALGAASGLLGGGGDSGESSTGSSIGGSSSSVSTPTPRSSSPSGAVEYGGATVVGNSGGKDGGGDNSSNAVVAIMSQVLQVNKRMAGSLDAISGEIHSLGDVEATRGAPSPIKQAVSSEEGSDDKSSSKGRFGRFMDKAGKVVSMGAKAATAAYGAIPVGLAMADAAKLGVLNPFSQERKDASVRRGKIEAAVKDYTKNAGINPSKMYTETHTDWENPTVAQGRELGKSALAEAEKDPNKKKMIEEHRAKVSAYKQEMSQALSLENEDDRYSEIAAIQQKYGFEGAPADGTLPPEMEMPPNLVSVDSSKLKQQMGKKFTSEEDLQKGVLSGAASGLGIQIPKTATHTSSELKQPTSVSDTSKGSQTPAKETLKPDSTDTMMQKSNFYKSWTDITKSGLSNEVKNSQMMGLIERNPEIAKGALKEDGSIDYDFLSKNIGGKEPESTVTNEEKSTFLKSWRDLEGSKDISNEDRNKQMMALVKRHPELAKGALKTETSYIPDYSGMGGMGTQVDTEVIDYEKLKKNLEFTEEKPKEVGVATKEEVRETPVTSGPEGVQMGETPSGSSEAEGEEVPPTSLKPSEVSSTDKPDNLVDVESPDMVQPPTEEEQGVMFGNQIAESLLGIPGMDIPRMHEKVKESETGAPTEKKESNTESLLSAMNSKLESIAQATSSTAGSLGTTPAPGDGDPIGKVISDIDHITFGVTLLENR